jgi:hypothetical protein
VSFDNATLGHGYAVEIVDSEIRDNTSDGSGTGL